MPKSIWAFVSLLLLTSILSVGDTHYPEKLANMVVLGAEQSDAQSLPFEATLAKLASVLPEKLRRPRVGIVCGSGLSTLAAAIRDVVEVPYASLPGFGKSTGTPLTLPCIIVGLTAPPSRRDNLSQSLDTRASSLLA